MLKETLKKMLAFGLSIIVMTAVIVLGVLHSYIDKAQLLELVVALLIALVVCVILSVVLSLAITKSIITPIEDMSKNLDNIENYETYNELKPFVNALAEQRKKENELNKQKKQFTANLSHELKTPLTSIAGYAELIETGIAKEEDIKPFASTIRKQALRLVSVSEDIIRLSQLEENDDSAAISFSSVDVYEIAEKCVKALSVNAELKGINVTLTGESTFIKGNSSLLEEMIYNLIDNAIRYNRENGSICVTVTDSEKETVISVKDTGIGIDEKYQERVFERFFRVDKSRSKETGGTGLGLAIVKHIAKIHGADIQIQSKIGEGTEISVHFIK